MRQTARTGCIPIRTRTTPLSSCKAKRSSIGRTTRHARSARTKAYCYTRYVLLAQSDERRATSDEPLVMVRIGAAAFDGVYGERKPISVDVHTHGGKTGITSK